MTGWTVLMRTLLARSMDLLGPPDARCLVCGDSRRGCQNRPKQAPDLGNWLCDGCLACIPWIRQIACPRCGRPVFCPDCVRQPVRAFEMNRSAVRYSDDMRKWLAMYKFRGDERYGGLLAELLLPAYERLTAEVSAAVLPDAGLTADGARNGGMNLNGAAQRCALSRPARPPMAWPPGRGKRNRRIWHAVTYVPASRMRAAERGFNQAERLARAAAMRADAPLVPLIRRLRDSGKQSQRSRAERLRAMRAVFGPNESEIRSFAQLASRAGHPPGEPLRVLLVDDIYTTGSTAEACAEAIRAASPVAVRVYVLTLARS